MAIDAVDRIDIRKLVVEEPPKLSYVFDQERDITANDFERMFDALKEMESVNRRQVNDDLIFNLTSRMLLLSPEKADEIIPYAQRALDKYGFRWTKESLKTNAWNWPLYARPIKELFPEREDLYHKDSWQTLSDEFYGHLSAFADWGNGLLERMSALKILHPDKFSELNLNENHFQRIIKTIDAEVYDDNNWLDYCDMAADTRILFPKKFKDFKLHLRFWYGAQKELQDYREEGEYEVFAKFALHMKILAAKEVKVTEKGLEIEMPQKQPTAMETPTLPEVKKYAS